MLHSIFLILKIIGMILLFILGFVLLVLALILLNPIRYRGVVRKKEGIEAQGKLTWLFRIVSVEINYDKTALSPTIRLFGRSLTGERKKRNKNKNKKTKEKKKKEEQLEEPDTKKQDTEKQLPSQTVPEPEKKENGQESEQEEPKREQPEQDVPMKAESNQKEPKKKRYPREKKASHEKSKTTETLRNKWERLKKKGESLKSISDQYLDFWNHTVTQKAKQHVLKEIYCLLRHIKPDRLCAVLEIGFDDPAITGQVLGILCVVSVFCGNALDVTADFERKRLQGEIKVSGHIRLIHIVRAGLSLLFDKNIRETWKRLRMLIGRE